MAPFSRHQDALFPVNLYKLLDELLKVGVVEGRVLGGRLVDVCQEMSQVVQLFLCQPLAI